MIIYFFIFILFLILSFYLYWRFHYFFRDPERNIPEGEEKIVSPADGTVIYIKQINDENLLFSTKKKREISLKEFCSSNDLKLPYYLIGIFMHPTSVHVNRSPISGIVKDINYMQGKNLPMTLTWWRTNLRMKPYEKYASHLFSNERNIIEIAGKIKIVIVQIADVYVNKIECWVKKEEAVKRGQRIGLIKMGSQVDVLLPSTKNIKILIKEGDNIKAGESVIAEFK